MQRASSQHSIQNEMQSSLSLSNLHNQNNKQIGVVGEQDDFMKLFEYVSKSGKLTQSQISKKFKN